MNCLYYGYAALKSKGNGLLTVVDYDRPLKDLLKEGGYELASGVNVDDIPPSLIKGKRAIRTWNIALNQRPVICDRFNGQLIALGQKGYEPVDFLELVTVNIAHRFTREQIPLFALGSVIEINQDLFFPAIKGRLIVLDDV